MRWLPQPLALLRESRVSRNVVPFSGRAWWRGGVEAEGTQQRGGRSGGRIVGADGEQLAGMRGGKVRLWRKVAWRTRPERQGFLPWSRGGVPRGPALPRRGGLRWVLWALPKICGVGPRGALRPGGVGRRSGWPGRAVRPADLAWLGMSAGAPCADVRARAGCPFKGAARFCCGAFLRAAGRSARGSAVVPCAFLA